MSLSTLEPTEQGGTECVSIVKVDVLRASLRARGELDAACATELAAHLNAHIDAGRRYLRLEMSAVTFIDSTALSAILAAHHRLLGCRGTLVLTGVRRPVSKLLDVTGLDRVLFVGGPRSDIDSPALWN